MAITFSDNAIISSLLLSALLFTVLCFHADSALFTVQLVHRDSPDSPFFNPLETHNQRLTHSLTRSFRRANRLTRVLTTQNPAQYSTVISADDGDYLVKVLVGTPPVAMFLVADTSSGLTWMQCESCNRCYNQTYPLFDPSSSSTYRQVPCDASQCQSLPTNTCEFYSNTCIYQTLSVTGISVGIVSEDTVSLTAADGQLLSLPNTTFGCGVYNIQDSDVNASGVVGLGPAMSSLFFKMSVPSFSYCLVPVPSRVSSKLNFGGAGAVKGPGTVSTPLYWRNPNLFYTVIMEAISVDGVRLPFQSYPLTPLRGNTIIDSGSALTYLPEQFYQQVETIVSSSLIHLQRVQDPAQEAGLCYKTESDIEAPPTITVHFDGADVELRPSNTFIRRSGDVVCLAFSSVSGNDGSAIYGNRQQMNFFIEYDLDRGILSFEPTDCTKL